MQRTNILALTNVEMYRRPCRPCSLKMYDNIELNNCVAKFSNFRRKIFFLFTVDKHHFKNNLIILYSRQLPTDSTFKI